MRILPVLAVLVLLAGGTGDPSPEDELRCADTAVRGTVTGSTYAGGDEIQVAFRVDRWVIPASGPATVTFPAREAGHGGGVWWQGDEGLLLLNPAEAPRLHPHEPGDQIEAAWRAAGASTDC